MSRTLITLAAMLLATQAQAACLSDTPQLGDVGPEGEHLCAMLNAQFPASMIKVERRELVSSEAVTVVARVNGRPTALSLRLIGADWGIDSARMAGIK